MAHRGVLVIAAAAVAVSGTSLAATAAVAPPPIVVEEVEPTQQGLVAWPPVVAVSPGADGRVEVEHQVVNGTDQELTVALSVQGIAPGADEPSPSAALPMDVTIAGDRVTLAPNEAAEVTSVAIDATGPFAYALVADVLAAAPPVSISSIVVVDPADAEVSVRVPELTPEAVEIRIGAADGPLLVDAAVRVRTWYGRTLADTSASDLLVWEEDPLRLRFRLEAVLVPGPYTVDVVARAGDGEPVERTVTRWLWPTAAVVAVGGALVILTGSALAIVWFRARGGKGASAEDREPVDPGPPA